MNGKIITLEGIECSGKGEQSKRLLTYFQQLGQPVVLTREPGGSVYSEALRTIIKHPQQAINGLAEVFNGHEDFPQTMATIDYFSRSGYCELFMFLAARAELVSKLIKPGLLKGQIIIIDRSLDSTRAYQGGGRFNSDPQIIATINLLNEIALQGVKPDLTIFLDIAIETMIARRIKSKTKDAHFEETCDREFFARTRNEYLSIARDEPKRFRVIDGEQTIDQVWTDIRTLVLEL